MRSTAYAELWGVVDGAVVDAFKNHPDYLTPKGQQSARASVVKRVCGTVMGFAEQSARGRLQPAETPSQGLATLSAGEGVVSVLPNPNCRIGKITFKRRASSRFLPEFNATTNALRRLPPSRTLIQGE